MNEKEKDIRRLLDRFMAGRGGSARGVVSPASQCER